MGGTPIGEGSSHGTQTRRGYAKDTRWLWPGPRTGARLGPFPFWGPHPDPDSAARATTRRSDMTVISTHHGLSVYTGADAAHGADTADNRRLRRPVDEAVHNTFNDATSGEYYDYYSGHQGIDFLCGVGTAVKAMYSGVVVKVVNNWRQASTREQLLGNHVTIRSCTDPANGAGFEHTYAHLQSTVVSLKVGDSVAKGGAIGTSGDTGTDTAGNFHLHVHLRAFGAKGTKKDGIVTEEYIPAKDSKRRSEEITKHYSRIDGCLNFAYFLPPDVSVPAITKDSFPEGSRRLLSPRDAFFTIPVYREIFQAGSTPNNRILLDDTARKAKTNSLGSIAGNQLGCHVVLDQHPSESKDPDWYRIQYSTNAAGWVARTFQYQGQDAQWVHIEEDVPTTMPEVQARPHFATPRNTAVNVRAWPSLQASAAGRLATGQCGAVLGYWDAGTDVPLAERRWWLIQYRDANDRPLTGWVRDDVVWPYGGATGVPVIPDPPQATVMEESVTLTWDAPAGNTVTGYGIWRGTSPENLTEVHRVKAGTTSWTDQPTTPLGTLYYYAVSAYGTGVEDFYSRPVGVITGHGSLGGNKTLAVAEANTNTQSTPNTGPNSLVVMLDSVFHKVKGVLWQNGQPGFLAVEVPPTRLPAPAREGWVPASAVKVLGTDGTLVAPASPAGIRLLASVAARSYLRLRSWVTGLHLRTGPSTAFAIHRLLTDTSVWYAVTGRTATTPVWYRLRYSDTFQGWVRGDYVELSEAAPAVAAVTPPAMPAETGPAHEGGTGTGTTTGSADGDFRNLVTNPDGRWAVSKSGTTVTANFSSPRSPVQYYARQNPQPQFVLPAGFRPTATVPRTVTGGTQVNEDRTPVPNAPAASFDLTIGTNGEMRYVNNSKVDHLGYVSYSVTALKWQSNEALTTPAQPGNTEDSGVYLNQQVNRGSSWELERRGNAVSGSFGCTRSPVHYYANGSTRAAQLLLPADYRPKANARFQVKGAVRVNQDGSDSTDRRKVDFWLTVQPNGEMWYDADTNLQTLGVGYLRYTVNVSWTAAPRITVPGIPRELEAEDIEATELELDWRRPAEDGGAAIDGYRIQVWDADDAEWDTEESDTNSTRTRYDVEDLAPYTTYRFRVAAHNTAGWGAFCPAITATTRRRAPGAPASLSATAAHDAVTLSWGAASGTVTGYTLTRRTGNGTWDILVADTGVTTRDFVDRTVSPATTYRYRVRGHNRGEAGTWSQERSIATAAAPTIPGQVTGLAVAPGTGSRLQLTWTAPTDTGGGITGHRIERSPDTAPRTWTVVREDTGSDTASWGDNDVAADTAYRYRVSARNSAGVGTPSAEAAGRSRPQLHLGGRLPYPLTAHASPWADAAVTATFAAYLPGRAYDLTARVPDSDGWWRVLLFGQGTTGPFWLPAAAGSTIGDTAALPQPPAAPASFTASLASGTVTLTWAAPPAGTAATGYRLWRQQDDGTWTQLGQDLNATTLTATDSTVTNGHVYRYRLQALADTGPGCPSNAAALAVMATPAAPAAVTGLQATATANTLQLAWTRAATGGLPTAYRVQWRVDGTADDFLETEVIGTAHTLAGLRPHTAYDLRVVAFNQVGEAPATTHTATTLQPVPGLPGAPNVAVTGRDATVTWQAPATGGPTDAYHLQAKTRATTDWPDTFTTVTGTTHTLTGLAGATAYDLRLRAANTAGASDWVAATFTTRPQLSLKATATTGLNVRSGPGTAHARVASIAGGSTTRYDILGKDAAT
ncbi:MAG: peptidoglycan DD-metalloendopeptidase family protein, partial [Chloroflexi bacterium]|nr:peptidoglycan DD-metalloendopeptidase family protein [Chloroflexota bacterium]